MQFVIQRPSLWDTLPSYTNFTGVIRFIGIILLNFNFLNFLGISMYAFEGQTMVKPIIYYLFFVIRFYQLKINLKIRKISWTILVYYQQQCFYVLYL